MVRIIRWTVAMTDLEIPSDNNIHKREREKLEMEKMWRMKATVVPVVMWKHLGAVNPTLGHKSPWNT